MPPVRRLLTVWTVLERCFEFPSRSRSRSFSPFLWFHLLSSDPSCAPCFLFNQLPLYSALPYSFYTGQIFWYCPFSRWPCRTILDLIYFYNLAFFLAYHSTTCLDKFNNGLLAIFFSRYQEKNLLVLVSNFFFSGTFLVYWPAAWKFVARHVLGKKTEKAKTN